VRLRDKLRIAAPQAFVPDALTLLTAVAAGVSAGSTENLAYLLAIPAAKAAVLAGLLLDTQRLARIDAARHRKRYWRRLKQFRKARRRISLPREDANLLERVDATLEAMYRLYEVADSMVAPALRSFCDRSLEQATQSLTMAERLSTLMDYLANESLVRLDREGRAAKAMLESTRQDEALRRLYAYTSRSKEQQVSSYQTAARNATLYRAQLAALEAGLANLRGRMASLAVLASDDLPAELELMEAEMGVLEEGIRCTAQVLKADTGQPTPPTMHVAQ